MNVKKERLKENGEMDSHRLISLCVFKDVSVRATDWEELGGGGEEDKCRSCCQQKASPNDDNNEPPTHCQPAFSLFTISLSAFVSFFVSLFFSSPLFTLSISASSCDIACSVAL